MFSTTHPKTDLPQAQKSSDRGPPASPDPESRAIAYPPLIHLPALPSRRHDREGSQGPR